MCPSVGRYSGVGPFVRTVDSPHAGSMANIAGGSDGTGNRCCQFGLCFKNSPHWDMKMARSSSHSTRLMLRVFSKEKRNVVFGRGSVASGCVNACSEQAAFRMSGAEVRKNVER